MRKFTTLFLLALAMTIGANQTFAAQTGGPNDRGRNDRPERDRPEKVDKDDPTSPNLSRFPDFPCKKVPGAFECQAPKRIVIKKEPAECGCVHKVMLINGRLMPFIDCYQSIEVNGRQQLRYCTKDDRS